MNQFGQTRRQLAQRYVRRSRDVPEWTVEFIGTAHVKNQGVDVAWQAGG